MSSESAIVFATFIPQQGKEDEVHDVLRTVLKGTRSERGNEVYDLYRSDHEGSVRFHLFERYIDADALQQHRDSEHYKKYRRDIADLLTEPIDVAVLREIDVQ